MLLAKTHDVLKSLLTENPDILKEIMDISDAADAKTKVQEANKELIADREKLSVKEKEKEKELQKMLEEIKRLQTSQLTDEDRKKLEDFKSKGMNPEVESKFNGLNATIESLQKTIAAEQEARKISEENAKKAELNAKMQAMDNSLITALDKVSIRGSATEFALAYIQKKNLATISDDGREIYTIYKDNKPFPATVEELAAHIAKTNEQLVSPSGNNGTGQSHSSQNSGSRAPLQTLQEIRDAAREYIELPK